MPYTCFNVPGWRFTGGDPSDAMLAVARQRLEAEGLLSRTHLLVGELHTLPPGPPFDGAQMMGVLHHVEGELVAPRPIFVSLQFKVFLARFEQRVGC